jgi:hypothetical protein
MIRTRGYLTAVRRTTCSYSALLIYFGLHVDNEIDFFTVHFLKGSLQILGQVVLPE